MDVLDVEQAVRRAAGMVRGGEGPVFVELRTYRFRAHSMYDPDLYRSKEEIAQWRERDPLLVFPEWLRSQGWLDDAALKGIEERVAAEVADAVAFAEAGTPEPVTELERFVYAGEDA